MCIITVLPPNVHLTREQIADALVNNQHGVGVMYSYRRQLYVAYSMSRDPRRLLSWLNSMPGRTTRVVHFRKQTAGNISRENLHPFVIHGRFGLMHNGTLDHSIAPRGKDEPRSDTRIFADDLLATMTPEMLTKPALWKLIDAAGEDNRIVMLDGETGKLSYTAEYMWELGYDDIKLSNTYSIQNGRVWGVRKTTFGEFHGYSTSFYTPAKVIGTAPATTPKSTYTNSPWNKSFDGFASITEPGKGDKEDQEGKEDTKWLKPGEFIKPTTDEEVLRSAYCLPYGSVHVPLAFATRHPLYDKAIKLLPGITMQGHPLSYSTIVLAILHAKLSKEEIDRLSPDMAELLVRQVIAAVKDNPNGAYSTLLAHHKETANVN
jgi:predicted glutamine amidotransferase